MRWKSIKNLYFFQSLFQIIRAKNLIIEKVYVGNIYIFQYFSIMYEIFWYILQNKSFYAYLCMYAICIIAYWYNTYLSIQVQQQQTRKLIS